MRCVDRNGQVREFPVHLKRKPSEYIASGRMYFTVRGRRAEHARPRRAQRHQALLFASDFPHETDIERAKHEIEELMDRDELSDEAKRRSSTTTSRRFYGPRLVKQQAKTAAL